jgi:hypothetical protein
LTLAPKGLLATGMPADVLHLIDEVELSSRREAMMRHRS